MQTVTISHQEYQRFKAQEAYIVELEKREKFLTEQLHLLKKARFGSKSEKATYLKQISIDSLFDEVEVFSDTEQEEPKLEEVIQVPAHSLRKKSLKESLPPDIPVVERHHYVDDEGRSCPHCSSEMQEIGKETRSTLGLAPARVFEIRDIIHVYACKSCDQAAEPVTVRKVALPPAVIPGGIASPEAIANIINDKFVLATPLYRQEQYWQRQGVMLSRQTMSNWLMYSVEHYFKAIYDRHHRDLLKEDILHADESELQVLREEGKSAQSKSYMWLYRTGARAKIPIVLYQYERDRKHARPKDYLKGFAGYLHSDGYEAYRKLENVVSVGCLAHVRRKFVEAAEVASRNKRGSSLASKAVRLLGQVFSWEKRFEDMTAAERHMKRLEKQKPLLVDFFSWLEEIDVSEKSTLGRAKNYALGQKQYLMNVFLDGRLEFTNNRAERSIKPFVIGRKNFLFANTPKGAEASAVLYSLVETAKETGVNPYKYFVYALSEAAKLRATGQLEEIAKLTPDYFKNISNSQEERGQI